MGVTYQNNVPFGGSSNSADRIMYDETTNVKEKINEVDTKIGINEDAIARVKFVLQADNSLDIRLFKIDSSTGLETGEYVQFTSAASADVISHQLVSADGTRETLLNGGLVKYLDTTVTTDATYGIGTPASVPPSGGKIVSIVPMVNNRPVLYWYFDGAVHRVAIGTTAGEVPAAGTYGIRIFYI